MAENLSEVMESQADRLKRYIVSAKKGVDWWALPFALELEEEMKGSLKEIEKFRASKQYKERLKDSIKNVQENLDREKFSGFSCDEEKDWSISKRRLLALLKEELKRA